MTERFVNNRREIKYLVSIKEAKRFRDAISDILIADPHNHGNGYINYSVYFDSPQLTFYKEQIQGLGTRSKPRLRTYRINYNQPPLATFLEFKHRHENLITKERGPLNSAQAQSILYGEITEDLIRNPNAPLIIKFAELTKRSNLEPTAGVIYHRMAFSCVIERGLRVTLDTRIQCTSHCELTPPRKAFKFMEPLNQAIIELKYDTKMPKQILNAAEHLEPHKSSYSKYVNAVRLIHGDPKAPMP